MSMDGSFRLNLELERLIARCPKLGNEARFSSLLEKVPNSLNYALEFLLLLLRLMFV